MAEEREAPVSRANALADQSQESAAAKASSDSMDGLAVTQELVSDMYKMGTIEDKINGTS